jgi:hypothetical protein
MAVAARHRIPHLRRSFIALKMGHAITSASVRPAAALAALVLLAAAAILFRFPPAQYSFYPQCPIHSYLGILCPGCGTTRAFSALLHGHLTDALRLNALTTLLLPIALLRTVLAQRSLRSLQPTPAVLYSLLAFAAIFTVARNL